MPKIKYPPLSVYLILIVFAAVLPVLAFSITMINHFVETRRQASKLELTKAASDLATAFDQDSLSTVRALDVIGKSESLRRNDLRTFQQVLIRIVHSQSKWASILLHGPNAEWLLSTRVKYGKKLGPAPEPESILAVVSSGQPIVGKIIPIKATPAEDPTPASHGYAIRVPVFDEGGRVKYILSAIITTESLQALINRFSQAPGEWVRAIADAEGTLGGRSREPEKFVGGKFSSSLLESLPTLGEGGIVRSRTLEGVDSVSGVRRAPFSRWYSAIAVPEKAILADARQAARKLFPVALGVLLFSAALTVLFSRWLAQAIKAGTRGAAILAKGGDPEIPESKIQEIAELRESLLTAFQLLRSRERAKSDFLAKMSHELRTPLGLVIGLTDVLANDNIAPEDRAKSWEIVNRNGRQLLRLIDDILDFSKIEANRLVVEHVEFSLPDLISSVVEDFSVRAQDKGLALNFKMDVNAPQIVRSDPVRLRQIISNLVGNAMKFTAQGSIEIRAGAMKDGLVQITITDTGIGLSTDQQALLFADFSQGDQSHARKYGGTGLGLALSRKLARLLGGDVRLIKSQPGYGSSFQISILSQPSPSPISAPARSEVKAISSPTHSLSENKRILLVEDSPDNVALFLTYLKGSDAQVTVATDGLEAVKAVRESEFDLIIMDLQMPNLDGFEATAQIRAMGITVPIIALSAHALTEHHERAIQVGFTTFLTKPIKRDLLLSSICELINKVKSET